MEQGDLSLAARRAAGPSPPDRAVTLLVSSADGGELPGIAGALVDQSLVGLLLLDESGAVVETNARGRQALSASGGLRERNGRLCAHRRKDVPTFDRLLSAVLDGTEAPRPCASATLGAWPDQRPLTVYVSPLGRRPLGRAGIAAVVTLVGPVGNDSGESGPGRQIAWPDASRGMRGCLVGRRHDRVRDRGGAQPEHGVRASVGQARSGQDLVLPPSGPGPAGSFGLAIAGAPRLTRLFHGSVGNQCCPTNFSAVRVESVRFWDQGVRSGVRTGPGAVFARTG